ncbi:hypothetical protein [uncultured Pseudoteredinibacter sp.]|uniref:hypothetical protein n=1 Tax=uncultured Pseudoteredinibacter sp. TaxID=1641701 RepID=UPI002629AFD6|nr:hypothetical protein [uncultured Pseudoteredinibacter sp.]
MKLLVTAIFLMFFSAAALASAPGILNVKIGAVFPIKAKNHETHKNGRPTIQFRVPNSGVTKEVFPEYEVTILRDGYEVAIVTARKSFFDIKSCDDSQTKALAWLKKVIPNPKLDSDGHTYIDSNVNTFATLSCSYKGASPFPELQLQFRGVAQDGKLEKAWAQAFK